MNLRSLSHIAAVTGGVVILAASASVAEAATTSLPVPTSACAAPVLAQPFLSFNDQNFYSLMPGENADSFNGTNWTLTGGAKIVTTTLADGRTGTVLDLPSNGTAASPVICVTTAYPVARMEIRDLVGAEGVAFNVEYLGNSTAESPKNTGQVHSNTGTSWDASNQVNIQPNGNITGWQQMRLVLTGKGNTSNFQIYNLYIDPRCMGA